MRLAELVAALWCVPPLAGEAQPATAVRRIGVLLHYGTPPGWDAFRAGLEDLGYVEGKNIAIDLRDAEGNDDRLATLAGAGLQAALPALASIASAGVPCSQGTATS